MKDTSKEFTDLQNELFNKLLPQQRLKMMLSMMDTARKIVLSSLPKGLSKNEIKKQLFLRFYSTDFSEQEKQDIIASICTK